MLRIGAKKELIFKKSAKSLSLDLLKGLLLALCFHLTLFFGLRIASPPNPDSIPPLAPAAVEVDLGAPQPLTAYPVQITFSPMDCNRAPQLLEMPQPSLSIEMPSYQQAAISEPDFSKIEKIEYEFLKDLEDDG